MRSPLFVCRGNINFAKKEDTVCCILPICNKFPLIILRCKALKSLTQYQCCSVREYLSRLA